jgi:hypothetical protein
VYRSIASHVCDEWIGSGTAYRKRVVQPGVDVREREVVDRTEGDAVRAVRRLAGVCHVEHTLEPVAGVEKRKADYTFVNQQLARHYGIPGVYGSRFRRVTLADRNRWGLLGKASVLAVTSYPHRTSPTLRGKWLLENILAAPVPPPPPTVNTNIDEAGTSKAASFRTMLEQHRANPGCAGCHARMDPLGFSLENFDAIGQWRTTDTGMPIDASGVLLDGSRVDGPAALRAALLGQKDQFVKAAVSKLLTYGLGREVGHDDAPAIRTIVRAAAVDNYRWSSTILAIVKSTPFQFRRARS